MAVFFNAFVYIIRKFGVYNTGNVFGYHTNTGRKVKNLPVLLLHNKKSGVLHYYKAQIRVIMI